MDDLVAQAEREQRQAGKNPPAREEVKAAAPANPDSSEDDKPPQKEKPQEMEWKERNDFMREQRHARRANKARAEAELGGVNMDDLVAQAEREQREGKAKPKEAPKSADAAPAQQKPKETPKPADPPAQPKPKEAPRSADARVQSKPKEAPKSADAPAKPAEAARARPRQANQARADSELGSRKMTDLVAQAERQQKATDVPAKARPPKLAVGDGRGQNAVPDSPAQRGILDPVAMKDLFRQQRDGMRLNRERIKKVRDGAHDPDLVRLEPNPPSPRRPQSVGAAVKPVSRRLLQNIPKAESKPSEEPFDLSKALDRRSTHEFIKSRSIVLDYIEQLQSTSTDDEGGNADPVGEGAPAPLAQEDAHLSGLLERANILNSVLDNLDDNEPVDPPDTEETSVPFFLPNKVLNFPVVRDQDSLAYRAEAIRAFLEREMGLDKVLALKQAVLAGDDDNGVHEVLKDCEPGIVVLAQQLLVLENCVDSM
jgi:hypothetical protein